MMSVTPVVVIGAVLFGRFVKNMSKAQQDAQAEATTAAGELSSFAMTPILFTNLFCHVKRRLSAAFVPSDRLPPSN